MCFTFDSTFWYAMWSTQTAWAIWLLCCTSLGGLWNNMVNKRNVNRLSKHTTATTAMTTTTKMTTTTPPALAPPPKIETIKKIQFRRLLAIFVIGGLMRFDLIVYSSSLLNWINLSCCYCRFFRMIFFTWNLVVYWWCSSLITSHRHRHLRKLSMKFDILRRPQQLNKWHSHGWQQRIRLNYAVGTCK